MKSWETALEQFLEKWKQKYDVIGILVCGSYITGNPSKRSDIDVHLIIGDDCDWRERGNLYVNGFLVEYFINPPKQISSYFKEDFNDRSTMSMVQFLSGRIILDKDGTVHKLVEEARGWKDKQYDKLAVPLIELNKYGLWDALDNLLDCHEGGRSDFELVYYNSLQNLYRVYCSLLSIEEVPYFQLTRYFTDPSYLKKYMKMPFPDLCFSQLFIRAIGEECRDEKVRIYKELTEYVLSNNGGFNIDGWKLRSKLEIL
jgi:predicted nucleotidyltransferase